MKLIKKIEISKFRSIYKQTIELDELTIFSGKNNSGKSNVLKALNLFFNTESNFRTTYNHDRDYNIAYTGQARGAREISIKIHFYPTGKGVLRHSFSVSRSYRLGEAPGEFRYHSDNPNIQAKIDDNDGNVKRQFTTFLNKINYIYVPAVRDRNFVTEMMLMFETLLEDKKSAKFSKNISELSKILEEKSKDISTDFNKFIGLSATASLSTSIRDVLNAARIYVETGIKTQRKKGDGRTFSERVDLFSSGDGILMSYIPHFLIHVFGRISSKNFILGFEEPENSLEYSKVQKLAESFLSDFVGTAQILVTTHSPAFIKLKTESSEQVKLYRVFINKEDLTQATQISSIEDIEKRQQELFSDGKTFSDEYKQLSEELAFIEQAQEIEAHLEKLLEKKKLFELEKGEFKSKLEHDYRNKEYPTRVFLCEDSSGKTVALWEELFKKWGISDILVLPTNGCAKYHREDVFRDKKKEQKNYNPKIFRQVDRDALSDVQVAAFQDLIESRYEDLRYKFSVLPVSQIENFWILINKVQCSEKFWEGNLEDIRNKFDRNAETQFSHIFNLFEKDHSDKSKFDKAMLNIQEARKEALKHKEKFMPGKEICKKIPNCNPIRELKGTPPNDFPQELKSYLDSIKLFFNQI